MLDPKTFTTAMAGLCEIFERTPSDLLIETYYQVLKNLSEDDFKQAIAGIMANNTYKKLPRPAEILEAIYGKSQDRATLAISKIEDAWSKGIGSYENVVFDDPIIHVLIARFGGWEKVCNLPDKEWQFVKREFEKSYGALSHLHPSHIDAPPILYGFHGSAENLAKLETYHRPLRVSYIGDKAKALEWSNKLKAIDFNGNKEIV